jgi:hypothetical protein
MFRSGQLVLYCTVESNYSNMYVRLAGASVIRDRALNTYESSYVHETSRPFFIPVVHSLLRIVVFDF